MSIAIDILMWPSWPNALPGTTATLAVFNKWSANSVSLVIFLLFCIYKFVETIYAYGPLNTYSIILMIIAFGIIFVLINLRSFNNAFNNVYPLNANK